jgi:hypothetical protein
MSRGFLRSLACLAFLLTWLSAMPAWAGYMMRYRHISLDEVQGIDVSREEEPNLEHVHLFERAFPTGYTLDRPGYRLEFRIDPSNFAPHVWIIASSETGKRLSLLQRSDRLPKSGRARPCGTYSVSEPVGELRYSWTICGTDATPNEFVIAFDVLAEDGTVIGQESLPFRLEENGFYFPLDGP